MNPRDLEKRHASEKAFHDKKLSGKTEANYYDIGFNNIIFNEMMNRIGNIENKKVVEFGCGDGWLTKLLATRGAKVWSFDISVEAVKRNRSFVNKLNLQDKVRVDQMAAESLKYDSNMFDLMVGNAILHHVDLGKTLKEIRRVLKKGGRAFFMEPLGHNPFLNLFRKVTPNLRSKDEMPMRFEQFQLIRQYFPKFNHDEFYLTTIFALVFYFLGARSLTLKARNLLFKLDKSILYFFPVLRKYCWYSIFELEKQ